MLMLDLKRAEERAEKEGWIDNVYILAYQHKMKM